MAKDPICDMEVDEETEFKSQYGVVPWRETSS